MNQHNPFLYVEIAWIMIMFNNSHYLLFAFFLPFLFIYVISYFWFSFSFFISISYYNCLTCIFLLFFSFMFVFIVLLFLYSYYLFLLSFAFCFFFFLALISSFSLELLNIISLFTIHQTNWIVSYHIDSIFKRNMWGFVLIVFVFFLFLCDSNIHSFLLQYPC